MTDVSPRSMRLSPICLLALAAGAACATTSSSSTAAPTLAMSDDGGAASRCAAVADSVRASTRPADLPRAEPQGRPKFPIPRGVLGGEIQTTFLVDPTGSAVRGTVVTVGGNVEFRSKMEEMVLRTRFRTPVVAGCPSWGRGEFLLRSEVRSR